MSHLAVDSGIYYTDISEISNDVKIVVESAEVDTTEVGNNVDYGGTVVSGCTKRNESHSSYLQVPTNNNSGDSNRMQHRGSIANLAIEVFTPENITTVLKLRLVATLTGIICVTSLLFVAPIVWYNVDQPSLELDSFEYESMMSDNCNVSACIGLYIPLSADIYDIAINVNYIPDSL